jgi:hypothetical protein
MRLIDSNHSTSSSWALQKSEQLTRLRNWDHLNFDRKVRPLIVHHPGQTLLGDLERRLHRRKQYVVCLRA